MSTLNHRSSTLTRAVDSLVDRKWAAKRPDPADRRAALVSMTPAGQSHYRRAQSDHDQYLAGCFAAIADPQALTAGLAELVRSLIEQRRTQ